MKFTISMAIFNSKLLHGHYQRVDYGILICQTAPIQAASIKWCTESPGENRYFCVTEKGPVTRSGEAGEPLGQELDLSGDVPEWEWGSHPKWLVNYSNSARFLASILLVEGIYRRSIPTLQ